MSKDPIVLLAQTRIQPEDQGFRGTNCFTNTHAEWVAEGYTVVPRPYEYEGEAHVFEDVVFPEYAPVRGFSFTDLRNGIIAPFGSQNHMVRVEIHNDRRDGLPEGATVTFLPTDEPETPFTPWDDGKARARLLATLHRDIQDFREHESFVGHEDERAQRIEALQKRIVKIESGNEKLQPPGDVLLFGRPCWIQNPIFPAHEGKAAYCLMVLETGWGDAGNIHLLFTTDAEGRPNKVWFEASCC